MNPIVCENSKQGAPASEWDVVGAGDPSIQGFATDISVDQGQTVSFKVNTTAIDFRLDIYRMGYYGGMGARKVATVEPSATLPQFQPACLNDGATGLIDCGNWTESASWAVPLDATSGIYFAKLVREDGTVGASHVVFVVRDDDGRSSLLFQTSDTTWQAYNSYGGNSLYTGSPAGRAYKVSYNRPFITRGGQAEDWVFNAEYPMVRWLERNGYDVSYFTDVDSDRRGAEILEHKLFLSVGHDEYWSPGQRTNVEAARAAGVHLAFFSGNEIFWKTRWEPSIDGSATPHRTLVSYKETHAGAKIDPEPNVWTGTWRDPRFSPPADGGSPENALSGTIFMVNGYRKDPIAVPAADGKMRFWRNTSVATLAAGATATLPEGTLGYEWDEELDNGSRPPGLIRMSSTTVSGVPYLQDYGSTYASGTATHHITLYRHASGALVFGSGTVQWSWGLDASHDAPYFGGPPPAPDARMQQATVNLFADMGVQPGTLQAGLAPATASTDVSAPTSTVTSPTSGAKVQAGSRVTVTGTASDTGGVVGGVEVSVDGGGTWHPTTGRESWTYTWTPTTAGSITIKSRAADDTGNVESPSTGVTITVEGRPCPCTLWSDATTPTVQAYTGDPGAVELGVRFQAESDGTITGLRFYKGTTNTGTHVGHLWTSSGAMLAEATFTGETVSGWQQVALAAPVAISANTTYIASYHAPNGNYAYDGGYFALPYDNPPLQASGSVYRYGPSGSFPTTPGGGNYWVDVLFTPSSGPDTTPPTVSSVSPGDGATGVPTTANVTATFNEGVDPATVTGSTFQLRDASNSLVAATVTYSATTRTATLDPTPELATSASYTATVKGGPTGVNDRAGNAMSSDRTWTFTTAAPPPPPPDAGPGGPILVIANSTNPFGRYYAEILRAEGLNEFTVTDISLVSAVTLAAYDVVILAEMPLTASEVTMLSDWVTAGGNLIAMRPDKQLAGLLGLTDASATLSNAYLLANTGSAAGAGIVDQTIQFHGTADRYTLNGAASVATLYSNAATATSSPAVTLRSVGSSGGQAAAFAYDLARSVIYTRQGNPAWAGQERDGQAPIRPNDLFFGAASADPQPDWIDLNKVAIPQADEQQRLLVNLIGQMNRDRKPLPRFWYFPRGEKAVVVMTGDDHGVGGTAGRFDQYKAASPAGCSVTEWQCIRSSSYIYPSTPLTDAQAAAYNADGFEVSIHVDTGCADWTATSLDSFYTNQLSGWKAKYTSVPSPSSERTHCIAWSDWATQAKVELKHGMRLDTNYYYWPPGWIQDRPGFFTGSGMPMRFGDLDGTIIDVYQAATQMTDESGQTYPFTIDALLDRARGAEGYYGAFVANMHTDSAASAGSDAIVASAKARGVPVVSGRQMLEWLDGRNGSSFGSIAWSGNTLTFTIAVGAGATGLRAMVPTSSAGGTLTGITRDGSALAYTTQVIKGSEYAFFAATTGSYNAMYGSDSTPPVISGVAHSAGNDTATITWTTDEASDSRVDYGTAQASLTQSATNASLVTSHSIALTGLSAGTTYYYRVTSSDAAGNAATSPSPADPPMSFTTPEASFSDTTASDFHAGDPGSDTYVAETANGELVLKPTVGAEFSDSVFPAGWSSTAWAAGGGATLADGALTLDGARAGTDALYGPGRSLEFVATFNPAPNQHVGLGLTYNDTPWAIFSTGGGSSGLQARTHTGTVAIDTPLAGNWLGAPHRYRIEWTAASVVFFIDGAEVASHAVAIDGAMRPLASDYHVGGGLLSVSWLRMSPYPASGTFLSRIFDAGATVTWSTFAWTSDTPAGTSLKMSIRTGDTPVPDATWSAFSPISSGTTIAASSRYIQYRAELAAADAGQTPTLADVTMAYGAVSSPPPPPPPPPVTVTAFPTATVIEAGSVKSGTAGSLSANDDSYYQVSSTTSGMRTTSWYGSFTTVANGLSNLKISYAGKNSRTCTQAIAAWRWSDETWIQLDSRSVGATEVAVENLVPPGTPGDYVSGTSGDGEVRIRVRCSGAKKNFVASGDLLKIVYER